MCESEDIIIRVHTTWNYETQSYLLDKDELFKGFCNECEEECGYEDIPGD